MKLFSIFLALFVSQAVFASSIEINATTVSGFDRVSGTEAKDCKYVLYPDAMNPYLIVMGLQSVSAPYNNTLVRIPRSIIPLQPGTSFEDARGYRVTYNQGVLQARRSKSGEGSANEVITMTLRISAELGTIYEGNVEKREGVFSSSPLAQMSCRF